MRVGRLDDGLDDDVGEGVDVDTDDALDDLADDELGDVAANRLSESPDTDPGKSAEAGDAGLDRHTRPDAPADDPRPETEIAGHDDPQHRAEAWAAYHDKVDDIYRAYAIDQGCERVQEIEEKIVTPAMQRIEAEDPSRHLVGLDHCLKGKDRIEEKVTKWMDADAGLTAEKAFSLLKDSIRYTFGYPENRYAEGVHSDCGRLADQGFKLVELRNMWDNDQYKGINSRWRVPDSGQMFEVQFHTEASFAAKQETHWAYEKLRSASTSGSEQDELVEYQRRITGRVQVPPGTADIPDYP
jgi:hypothetical protein